MRIVDLINKNSISLEGAPQTKADALNQMVDLMAKGGNLTDADHYRKEVFNREEQGSTGFGEGIAIPHGKSHGVNAPGLAAMVIKDGVDFDSLDGEKVHLIFLIAAPDSKDNVHLDVLSKLSVLLMDEVFSTKLKNAASVDEFLSIIDEADVEKEEKKDVVVNNEQAFMILGVTSCPTGIAHTYMAAEGLEKAAQQKGCFIKVETRGSGGAKNVLTDDEIAKADAIIIAADAKVPMDRFDGKKVIEAQVSDGINKADKLIDEAMGGNVPIYHAANKTTTTSVKKGSIGHQIYTQLMNGVSHMLPFVVGGGILIALAFLFDGFSVDLNSLPFEERGNFGSITPLAALFKNIGGIAFGFMLPILSGFIGMAIADRPALAVGFVGGMIASQGKSGFLGALVAGFAAGYLVLLLKKIFDKLPPAIEKIAPVLLYPVFGILIMGLLMIYIVEPFMGGVNTALNNGLTGMGESSRVLLGLLLGAMMATDMGGPFNKAAYVFGTAAIASGNYDIMASVMIGGMTPPCAIALATLLFKNKFTKEEREAGPTNFIMGLGFITEGAIPYAAADPFRVIPSCMVGSGVAGALSMIFNCTLMAPHGGVFVFPVVGNAMMYILALVIGTVVSAIMLGLLKKKVD
ncbi:PTS system fructose-specific IIC component [Aequitasia blattaphilus]|uniref:Fructose-specific PTS transporter subunit EIIC n=1 Tax=Aequitasia blattaphilus TaxID=2949332 RepID=A0ABT1E7N4_9FIRM|nr:fructose-specific PTS transporter subunit EIIC [Aequitasia blattaphilus]MCP1101834.1 fructose-specific PTS transporter subunit EIIC [Aequitasia blattaphilus]MCR8614474.1 fructose-specific PTS transporter subunit EIIC [Aequitasia blattaphilus]